MSGLDIALLSIAGILLGVWFTHRLTIYRERQKETRASIAEFKDNFTQVLNALTDSEANPTLLITENFPAHKEAAIKLIEKLPSQKAKKFSEAWANYQGLYQQKASLGTLGMFAAEITDSSRTLDPNHIYEVNTQRRNEAIKIIRKVLVAVER